MVKGKFGKTEKFRNIVKLIMVVFQSVSVNRIDCLDYNYKWNIKDSERLLKK